jgi:hypothetical protein
MRDAIGPVLRVATSVGDCACLPRCVRYFEHQRGFNAIWDVIKMADPLWRCNITLGHWPPPKAELAEFPFRLRTRTADRPDQTEDPKGQPDRSNPADRSL